MLAANWFVVTDANLRQIRVLHIVSAGALAGSLQQSLFMPLLTRLPRPRVKSLVTCLSPGAVPSAVLRQSGVPTYDLAISRKRFSPRAFQELQQATRNFRPDVIQAWGHTAQVISAFLRKRCEWKPKLIWNVADTLPLAKDAGLIDRQKLKYAARFSGRADRIVYSSEAAASQHRRVGFPDGGHEMIPPGVDATRFKPDFAARRKLREQWNLPGEAFVVGMYAPFQAESDFSTLIKAFGELIKINPHVALVLAGHGVQKGNAPLMALVGSGALATRVHLLGEWSDISALYNACDVVCSSALNDQARMNIVMAMLCGVPCVATGMGAQGEIIGQHGVAIEPGNPSAFVKGITRVMQMTPEKRTFMAQGARKHALGNYVYVRSLQRYLQLYYDLIGRQALVTQDLPSPEIDPTLTVPPALPTEAEINASKRKPLTVADFSSDPDSLESKVTEREPEELPKWRIEQEQERTKREAEVAAQVAATQSTGDVLQVFEAQNPSLAAAATPMTERARGVADDVEELLSPDLLASDAPVAPRTSNAPSGARKSASNVSSTPAVPQPDADKQAKLRAAQKAALQPIAPTASKPAAAAPKPVAKPAVVPVPLAPGAEQSVDFNSTQPFELLPAFELIQTSPAKAAAVASAEKAPVEKTDASTSQPVRALSEATRSSTSQSSASSKDTSSSGTHPLDVLAESAASSPLAEKVDGSTTQPLATVAAAEPEKDGSATQPLEILPDFDLSAPVAVPAARKVDNKVSSPAPRAREPKLSLMDAPEASKTDKKVTPPERLPEIDLSPAVASIAPKADSKATSPTRHFPEIDLSPAAASIAPKVDSKVTSPTRRLPETDLSPAAASIASKADNKPASTAPLSDIDLSLAASAEPKLDGNVTSAQRSAEIDLSLAATNPVSAEPKLDAKVTSPAQRLPEVELSPAFVAATTPKADSKVMPAPQRLPETALSLTDASAGQQADKKVASSAQPSVDIDLSPATSPALKAESKESKVTPAQRPPEVGFSLANAAPAASVATVDSNVTQPQERPAEIDSALMPASAAKVDGKGAQAAQRTPEANLSPAAASATQPVDARLAKPAPLSFEINSAAPVEAASPLGRLARALATKTVPTEPVKDAAAVKTTPVGASIQTNVTPAAPTPSAAQASHSRVTETKPETSGATASMTAALEKWNSSFDLGELSLMATGAWMAKKPEPKVEKSDGLSGAEALSLISSSDETGGLKLETQPATGTKRTANGHS